MMAAKMAGVPIRLHTVAGLPLWKVRCQKKCVGKSRTVNLCCATKVYPNSQNLAQFILAQQFCKAEKLKVLGNGSSNGIDTSCFKPNAEMDAKAKN